MADDVKTISPSEFMRALRPEYYSDSEDRIGYELEPDLFEYHLDTLTSRNQTRAFEIFCRKLAERVIAKNLRPQTGPEGGGDGKADSETLPVAEEIAELTYVADVNAGKERWAFAFSAKKTWKQKIKNDVDAIVATGRGYQRIICITSRFARAKDRALLEDELTTKHNVPVTIYDRTWIVETVTAGEHQDLAFNYLEVGRQIEKPRLGPEDYTRAQQLEDIEKQIADPAAFDRMETQLVTEALVAAKLSRNMERPRVETEGRFARAVKLADKYGTYRQKLEAHYEAIWTAFWYFDELDAATENYDRFEAMAIESGDARDVGLICNLFQLLVNLVVHLKLDPDEVALKERADRLKARLQALADERARPNNGLEAEASILTIEMNFAAIAHDRTAIAALWPRFADVLERAKALGEFDAEGLLKMIDAFGLIAGADQEYTALVEATAAFVTERKGEAEGAKVLLKRAGQLGMKQKLDMIRLLGRAAHLLTKKEYADYLIEAMGRLAVAYRSAGLFWASRASFAFALASIAIESNDDNAPRIDIIPHLKFFAWAALELRHLPDFIKAMQHLNGARQVMALSPDQRAHVEKNFGELDLACASRLLNLHGDELRQVEDLPDVLGAVGLLQSRMALTYALGHEAALRADGWIPAEEPPEGALQHFTLLASQPVSDRILGPLILNADGEQCFATSILGVEITVKLSGTDTSIMAAEAVLGTLEAYLATAIEMGVHPHTESFAITLIERDALETHQIVVRAEAFEADLLWPIGLTPGFLDHQQKVQDALLEMAGVTLATISFMDEFETVIASLHRDDAVMQRMALIAVASNSHSRMFGQSVARLSDWAEAVQKHYPLREDRPRIARTKLERRTQDGRDDDDDAAGETELNHRDASVRSVLNVHLWERAGWKGAGYLHPRPNHLPGIALLFENGEAAAQIFEQWRERFGETDEDDDIYIAIITDIDAANPAHYRLMITARPSEANISSGKPFSVTQKSKTMTPASNGHLIAFLEDVRAHGGFELVPAVLRGAGQEPEVLEHLALKKKDAHVKAYAEIGPTDLELMAFPELADKLLRPST